ncbi:uncharacterized protein [Miscanthus floridulus]|uniref:uncharacterized protein n=1 Tax=Miscanthus floridulus TaxID=154761 RepID=UPI00345AF6DF
MLCLGIFFGVINARPLARDLFMACVRHSKHQELKDFSLSIGILQVGCKISPGMADLVNKLKATNVDVFLVSGAFRQMIKAKLLPNGQDNVNVSFCKLIDLDYGFRRNN